MVKDTAASTGMTIHAEPPRASNSQAPNTQTAALAKNRAMVGQATRGSRILGSGTPRRTARDSASIRMGAAADIHAPPVTGESVLTTVAARSHRVNAASGQIVVIFGQCIRVRCLLAH